MPKFYKEKIEEWIVFSGSKKKPEGFVNYSFAISFALSFLVAMLIPMYMIYMWIAVFTGMFTLFHGFLVLAIEKRTKFVEGPSLLPKIRPIFSVPFGDADTRDIPSDIFKKIFCVNVSGIIIVVSQIDVFELLPVIAIFPFFRDNPAMGRGSKHKVVFEWGFRDDGLEMSEEIL